MNTFLLSLVNLFLAIWNIVFRGLLIKVFWGWFVLTQFSGLPKLEVLGAIGLSLFVCAITPWRQLTNQELNDARKATSEERIFTQLINGAGMSLGIGIAFLWGWVVHLFF